MHVYFGTHIHSRDINVAPHKIKVYVRIDESNKVKLNEQRQEKTRIEKRNRNTNTIRFTAMRRIYVEFFLSIKRQQQQQQ